MRRQFFRRSTASLLNAFRWVVLISLFVVTIKVDVPYNGTGMPTELIIAWIIYFAISLLSEIFIPPNFNYYVRAEKDYIIFELSETDHRPILRKYYEVSRKHGYMLLQDDIGAIISIPYSAEVLEFLKQVRIE